MSCPCSDDFDPVIGDEEDENGSECTDTDSESDFDAPPMRPISESYHEVESDTGKADSNLLSVTICAHLTNGNHVENNEPQRVEQTSCALSRWRDFKLVNF